mmetsp:Transcript_12750/g.50919  ORF Transcript_12750/g.50919 Transcript_12750/m.50919 type:complete len:206 (+) Transcript_12750:576-1193(+)
MRASSGSVLASLSSGIRAKSASEGRKRRPSVILRRRARMPLLKRSSKWALIASRENRESIWEALSEECLTAGVRATESNIRWMVHSSPHSATFQSLGRRPATGAMSSKWISSIHTHSLAFLRSPSRNASRVAVTLLSSSSCFTRFSHCRGEYCWAVLSSILLLSHSHSRLPSKWSKFDLPLTYRRSSSTSLLCDQQAGLFSSWSA